MDEAVVARSLPVTFKTSNDRDEAPYFGPAKEHSLGCRRWTDDARGHATLTPKVNVQHSTPPRSRSPWAQSGRLSLLMSARVFGY